MLMRFGTRVALNLMTSNSLVVVSPVCGGKSSYFYPGNQEQLRQFSPC